MEFIKAKTIAEHVPDDLPALRVVQRGNLGPTVRLCAVGDIGLSGRAFDIVRHPEGEMLFAEVASFLRSADITFGNLESPFAWEIAPGKMFAAPVAGAAILRKAGFNLLNLANNHIADYGQAGISATLKAVQGAGIISLGCGEDNSAAQQLVRTDKNGLRIGWLGCGRTLLPQNDSGPRYWELNEKELLAGVLCGRSSVDVLIVSIHAGLMFLDYPHPDHKAMVERLMQAGADLVLMHHAHVMQGVEITEFGRVCCYNLGNFLWDWLEGEVSTRVALDEQQQGGVFVFDLAAQGVASLTVFPIWIDAGYRVRWANREHGEKILRRLQGISLALKTNYHREFGRQRVERNFGHILRDIMFHVSRGKWRYVYNQLSRIRFEDLWHIMTYPFIKKI